MASRPDIEGLRRFARSADRDLNEFFVGRAAELADLRRRCDDLLAASQRGGSVGGKTTVITACPGMGKTSLLQRFQQTVCNDPDDPGSPLAIQMRAADLRTPDDIAGAVAAMMDTGRPAAGLVRAIAEDLTARLRSIRTYDAFRAHFRRTKLAARPMVLLVDEAQNLGERNMDAVEALHGGDPDLPILPVFAGLNDTEDAVEAAGISRLAGGAVVQLGFLTEAEAKQSADAMLTRFGAVGDEDELESWREEIARSSLGFPQHLHAALTAAAAALADHDGQATPDGLRAARVAAEAKRRRYYEDRIPASASGDLRAVLAHLVERIEAVDSPVYAETLADMALAFMREQHPDRGYAHAHARQLVSDLIHNGVLQETETGGRAAFEVPIPSMRTWLLDVYVRDFSRRA